jgi:hypothetical protein
MPTLAKLYYAIYDEQNNSIVCIGLNYTDIHEVHKSLQSYLLCSPDVDSLEVISFINNSDFGNLLSFFEFSLVGSLIPFCENQFIDESYKICM